MFGDLWRFNSPRAADVDWFRQVMDEFFPTATADIRSMPRGTFPMLNMGRTDEAVLVYVFAPGLGAQDVDISVQDNVLTLKGRREPTAADDKGEHTYYRKERFSGEFARSITLPEGVDSERAEARTANGLIEIRLPKQEQAKPRRVEVKPA
ncbi:MAG TPA: Hsp20/alpha crystallin family protein [Guyparkeria sp.]|nr:Hsp20/alpha crystallin family protein [Guyparkeria sp.]